MSQIRIGAPLSATCQGAPKKCRYINDIHPEITVVSKNVLWFFGWCTPAIGEPYRTGHEVVGHQTLISCPFAVLGGEVTKELT